MASDITTFIILVVAIYMVMNFIIEVPKQLKRIADALEKRVFDKAWCVKFGRNMDPNGF